jgi:hypothetical protein
MLNAFGVLKVASVRRNRIYKVYEFWARLTVQNTGADAGRQFLQALEQIPNLVLLDVAEVCHEVRNLAS